PPPPQILLSMSDPKSSNRRRGGMRFRPTRGIHPHQHQTSPKIERAAQDAGTEAESGVSESVFNTRRYESEIEHAEAHNKLTPASGECGSPSDAIGESRQENASTS